jgi:hypothetical protein
MPPRRYTRSTAAAEQATTALSPLPLPIVLHIFSLLPVDCRLRCSEVCRGWRAVLTERSLWTRLDLSAVALNPEAERAWDALLRCAAARAGGALQSLHIRQDVVSHAALLEVTAANAGALRELRASVDPMRAARFEPDETEALCVAAPQLRTFTTDMACYSAEGVQALRRVLRNEAPFGPLRAQQLFVSHSFLVDEAGVIAFATDMAAHPSLKGLTLYETRLDTAAAMGAMADAALACQLQTVHFYNVDMSAASVPALARMLGSTVLTELICEYMDTLDMPLAAVLTAALRGNRTLTSLTLDDAGDGGLFVDVAAAAELLGALHGHPSLHTLRVVNNRMAAANRAAVGAMLGALVAANAPALTAGRGAMYPGRRRLAAAVRGAAAQHAPAHAGLLPQ